MGLAQQTDLRLRPSWYLLGPAFVAAIAYVDPGNVAANVSAGAQFGFLLVWVILLANGMAGLVQYLSAKLGLVTGHPLPEAVGDRMRRPSRLAYWVAGGVGGDGHRPGRGGRRMRWRCTCCSACRCSSADSITGVVSLLLLLVQDRRGQRMFERVDHRAAADHRNRVF